jgi:glycine/D-amino acid oxidase-like deaminating enzyme
MDRQTDLLVVGAGIVGLAHALAAARRGLRVTVVDRDAQANGASVRNFGFVTVTGQQAGACWRRAIRSRDVWLEVAPQAGIEVVHRGLCVAARRPEAEAVLQAFAATGMAEGCRLLTPRQAREYVPALREDALRAVLWSPHELRVESRDAMPEVDTTAGRWRAQAAIVCAGDDFLTLYPQRLAAFRLARCALQMMRLRPEAPVALGAAVMSDLGLVRYLGYAELEPAAALRRAIQAEEPEMLEHGVHLIAVQSADGTLVVGDSHHTADTPPPFGRDEVDALILREFERVLAMPARRVVERWIGTYATAPDRLALTDAPADRVRVVVVTSGTGASTAFAIAEETIAALD